MSLYDEIKSPLDDVETLKSIVDIYVNYKAESGSKTVENGDDFYSGVTKYSNEKKHSQYEYQLEFEKYIKLPNMDRLYKNMKNPDIVRLVDEFVAKKIKEIELMNISDEEKSDQIYSLTEKNMYPLSDFKQIFDKFETYHEYVDFCKKRNITEAQNIYRDMGIYPSLKAKYLEDLNRLGLSEKEKQFAEKTYKFDEKMNARFYGGEGVMGFHIIPQKLKMTSDGSEREKGEMKFYLNAGINTYKVAQLFQQKCEQAKLNYYFKVVNADTPEYERTDKMCIYTEFKDAEKFLGLIREIKLENPDINFQTPPMLAGRIDEFIGVGMDSIGESSYNQSMSTICYEAVSNVFQNIPRKQIPDFIDNHPEMLSKLKEEIKKKAKEIGVDEEKLCVIPEVRQKIETQEQDIKDFVHKFMESYKRLEKKSQYDKRLNREESDIEYVAEYVNKFRKGKIGNEWFLGLQPDDWDKYGHNDFSQNNIDRMFRMLNAANNLTVGDHNYFKTFYESPEIVKLLKQMQESPAVQSMIEQAEKAKKLGKQSRANLRGETPAERDVNLARKSFKSLKKYAEINGKHDNYVFDYIMDNSHINHGYDNEEDLALAKICCRQRGIKTQSKNLGGIYKLDIVNQTQNLDSISKDPYASQINYSFEFDKKPEDYLVNKNIENYLSDMVDKYYGDKNKEKEYNAAMRRFKQNLQKDPVTGKEIINFYPDKENDLKILQLELYEEKSEKLARAAAGESVYSSMKEMQEDKAYIDTKNYSYNRYISTKNNLVTLGKYGEKVNYLAVKTEPNVLKKIGHALVNIPLGIRNVGAVVYRGIGKPVSKIYGKIAKTDSGIYSNKPAHRYEARKDYFVNQETQRLQAEGKNPQPIRTLFKARFKALVNYKEGNAAVLEAGYQDIKKSFTEKAKANYFSDKLDAMDKHINNLKYMKNALYVKPLSPENAMKINEIERAEKETEQMKQKILTNPRLQGLIKDGKIINKEVVQTDAISYNQHDRANKANVTRTITGIKAIGNVGIQKFVGPRIKDWMLEHCKIQEVKEKVGFTEVAPNAQTQQQGHEWVESVVTTEEVPDYVTKISSQEKLLDQFSIKNIMKNSQDNNISYAYNNAGDTGVMENLDFFRGAAQKINGKTVSLSDANGFDPSKVTSGVIPEELLSGGSISDDANLFDILAALQKQAGNDVSAQDLVNKVLNCNSLEEQQKMIAEMSNGLDFWKSRSQTGIANGWNSTQDEIQNILANSQDALVDSVQVGTHTVKHVTKGHSDFITMPGEEMINAGSETIVYGPNHLVEKIETVTELVDNPRIVKALNIADEIMKGATVMDAITMFFENVRDTKSKAKDNKQKPRNYNPQPQSNKVNFKGKSKNEDKQIYNAKRKVEENDVTAEIQDIDDEISR